VASFLGKNQLDPVKEIFGNYRFVRTLVSLAIPIKLADGTGRGVVVGRNYSANSGLGSAEFRS
jgi:hypothetical protein